MSPDERQLIVQVTFNPRGGSSAWIVGTSLGSGGRDLDAALEALSESARSWVEEWDAVADEWPHRSPEDRGEPPLVDVVRHMLRSGTLLAELRQAAADPTLDYKADTQISIEHHSSDRLERFLNERIATCPYCGASVSRTTPRGVDFADRIGCIACVHADDRPCVVCGEMLTRQSTRDELPSGIAHPACARRSRATRA